MLFIFDLLQLKHINRAIDYIKIALYNYFLPLLMSSFFINLPEYNQISAVASLAENSEEKLAKIKKIMVV